MKEESEISRFLSGLILFLFVFNCIGTFGSEAQTLPIDEVNALKQVGNSLGKADWNFTVDPCSRELGWITPPDDDLGFENNVTCNCSYSNNKVCHVVSIALKAQNLSGVLPPELVRLPFLQNLDLSRNYLKGTIPTEWASSGLVVVSLLGNRLSGPIPKFLGNITSLADLNIEVNHFSGSIPPELGNLTNLERILLSSNQLTGQLPRELAKLTKMRDFRISDNNITGKIPDFIQNWTKLQKLAIQGCALEGPIPSGISVLEKLTDLRISDINGTGSIFPDLSKMLGMNTLVLRNCLISGNIPEYIRNMTELKILDLSFNNLTGKIPTSFGSLSRMDFAYFTRNRLTGPLPGWIQKNNHNVDVSYNNLTWTSSGPTSCSQQNINLVSSYSSTVDNLVPSCLKKNFPCAGPKNQYSLHINCGGKELTDGDTTFKADLEPSAASRLYLGDHWAFSSTGNFMDDHKDSDNYIATNISTLSMPYPELYTTARLSPLSLTYYGLCMINGNYIVKLHFAEIMFTSDNPFSSLGRRIFDVYIQEKLMLKDFNIEDEAGGLGKEIVRNFTASVMDNTLEIRFYWTGKGTQSMPRRGVYGPLISAISVDPDFEPPSGGKKISAIIVVAIVASVVCIILLILGALWRAGWMGGKEKRENELRSLDLQTGSFTLRQIKAATNNFDPKNKIGEGGFGPVYKGLLSDGTIIAVKQLSSKSKQGNREFVNEIGMITALRHPNLVKLYGCCIEGNQLSLIYEFMENNSLAHALFGQRGEGQLKLDWPTRRNICIGIARGLTYLHEESRLKIVHRDIKATNVLLDEDLNAKISDFGLAKLDEEENTHISTRIAGTIGYMAPEYAMRGYLTDKADVYSFGIVALEIVSGKSNTNYRPKEECVYLLDWAIVMQETGNLAELIDPNLGSEFSMEEALNMLKVALLCTNMSPTLRPMMSAVVSMLEGRTVVQELISGESSSRSNLMFKAIRNHSNQNSSYSQIHNQTQSMSMDGPWTSSSASVPDLYPISYDTSLR